MFKCKKALKRGLKAGKATKVDVVLGRKK